ncbi:hypothetical protein [Paenibacillus thiaminolyticus]|uniref:HEPN AbiU2-like domain-containing protein n=1 Tax=Paenibacillus thiaminolyticus TaxID=49283 RepID=A0A3A3GKE4_PANTH|nr:hypothetical protein [Paenibacillus thiaminolyticus]RJG25327.1 hypothetical protein DQX05_07785 [Paenibacillus thiaminolyticus]
MKQEDIYLRTDERSEAYNALIKTIQFLDETNEETYNWKWFLISLHNCLQAFMVLALKGSSSLSVMKPHHARKWLNSYETNNRYHKVKMDHFINLFEKIQSDVMMKYTDSKIFASTEQISTSIHELNELRNNFIHYMPKGWSLNISGLPSLGLDVVGILRFLVNESGNIDFFEVDRKQYTEQLIEELSRKLTQMKHKYVV